MTKRQFQRLQCRLRRSVNSLYYSYLTSMLRGLQAYDQAGDVDRMLATLPARHCRGYESMHEQPSRPAGVQRELKLRGDFGCARVRERLWQLQHLQIDLSPAGDRRALAGG